MNKSKIKIILEYKVEGIEKPITKEELRELKKVFNEFTLRTNAGIELHSSEVKQNKWENITFERL